MKPFVEHYQTFLDWLEKVTFFAAMSLAAALFLVTSTGIIVEQVTGNSLVWVEEINNLLFVWLVFLGAGAIARRGGHIGVDILYGAVGKNLQLALRVIYCILALIIVWVMVFYGLKMASFVGRSQTSLYLDISLYYYYLAIPIGGILLGFNSIGALLGTPDEAPEDTSGNIGAPS